MATVVTSCNECGGSGMVTRMEPAPLKGCKLRSSHRLAPQNIKCAACSWGRVRVEVEPSLLTVDSEQPLTYHGHEANAPGFTQDQFDRAVVRAFIDDLEVTETDTPDRSIVGHQGTGIGYHTTRKRCGCKAGSVGSPCKHRAILIAHLNIRQPAIERQWQKLRADRRGAKAVA